MTSIKTETRQAEALFAATYLAGTNTWRISAGAKPYHGSGGIALLRAA
jgi:hypothetical protein